MKKYLKYLPFVIGGLIIIGVLVFGVHKNLGASVLFPYQGGVGKGTATAGDVGKYLKVSNNSPFTYSFDTPAGGTGGATDQLGQIGDVSTTTLAWGSVISYNTSNLKWESVATSTLSLVPYTGATADVDLGAHKLTVANASTTNITASGYLNVAGVTTLDDVLLLRNDFVVGGGANYFFSDVTIPQNSDTFYAALGSTASSTLNFLQSSDSSGLQAIWNFAGLTLDRTFTFPNLTGTFALLPNNLKSTYIPFGDGTAMLATSTKLTFNDTTSLLTVTGNASSTQLTTTGSTYLAIAGGNVGIGTSTPAYKLDIVGDIGLYSNNSIYFDAPTNNTSLTWSGTTFDWESDGNLSFNFTGAGSPVASFIGGNVGIGTVSPNNTIQVADLINFDNTNYGTSLGYQAGYGNLSDGLYNTFLGYQAGYTATSSDSLTLIGYKAGYSQIDGATNASSTFIGSMAGYSNTYGLNNTFVGAGAGYKNTTGNNNSAMGFQALRNNTTGSSNSAMGVNALLSNTTGGSNSAMGVNALYTNTSGSSNSAMGFQALRNNTSGGSNSAVGYYALYTNTTGGNSNSAMGYQALRFNTSGYQNSAMGMNALYANTTGNFNSGLGYNSLYYNKTGHANTVLGTAAGYGVLDNSFTSSTLVGYRAGYGLSTGSNNILLGYQAGDNLTTGASNIIIGYDIDAPLATSANTLNIGNLLFGTGIDGTGTTLSSGNIGIGTTTPAMKFSVHGDALADSWNVYSDIYQGDALTKLKGIKAEKGKTGDWVKVNHNTLPDGILKNNPMSNYINFYEPITEEKIIDNVATTITTYKKISNGTIISEDVYNKLPEAAKGKTNTWILPTMSISNLAVMNSRGLVQLDERLSKLEEIKLGGAINSDGEYISEAVKKEIDDRIDAKKDEIKDYVIQAIQQMSFWEKLKLLFN